MQRIAPMLSFFNNARGLILVAALSALFGSSELRASRIKDLSVIEGDRDNQLVGYGLVVGLAGDGDSNPQATLHSVANVLQRYGITVNPQQDITAKNSAAVMVTADISAFLKSGARIDVTVASMGDAKALQGGILLQTPLIGADGRVYAVAQGAIAIGGFLGGTGGAGGATVQKNHPTVGTISNGAIVEREIPSQIIHDGVMRLLLHNPDFNSAARMADAINEAYPAAASAVDAATIQVHLPQNYRSREVSFIADLGVIDVISGYTRENRHQRAYRYYCCYFDSANFSGSDRGWIFDHNRISKYRSQANQNSFSPRVGRHSKFPAPKPLLAKIRAVSSC